MNTLPILIELQATHDYLMIIQRDLTALPPDLAALDQQIKAQDRRLAELDKATTESTAHMEKLTKDLELAKRLEEHARQHLKTVDQKVKYAAAIRELDERERLSHGIERPLKELHERLETMTIEQADLTVKQAAAKLQFEELHQIFLAEHENQVASRVNLQKKQKTLEAKLPPSEVTRFDRLFSHRQGRAVVKAEGGICTGCRMKIRSPFLMQMREATAPLVCESCSRILYLA